MRSTLVRVLIVLCFFGTLIAPTVHAESAILGDGAEVDFPLSVRAAPQSTVNRIDIFFSKENSKTSIFVRICADAANYQLRAGAQGETPSAIYNRTAVSNGCSPSQGSGWRMVYNIDPGPKIFWIYASATDTLLSDSDFMSRAARYSCHVTGYGTGYCDAPIVVTAPQASIDVPSDGKTVSGVTEVGGWATDFASLNGPGVNEVQIYVGDTFMGTAFYGNSRPDVGAMFGDSRFNNSAFTYNLDTTRIPNGAATIRVAAKSTLTGQWNWFERRVTVSNISTEPQPTPKFTRSRLFITNPGTLVLEFCGTDIHQDVFVGAKRIGKDFGTRSQRVDFGGTEQCATNDRILDGSPRPGLTYQIGVALAPTDVYNVCSSSRGLCDSFTLPTLPSTGFKLPFPGGTTKRLNQGNNSAFSHQGYSAYAFDWGLRVGDPVVAARAGRVINVRQDSGRFGCSRAYINDANRIIIRHDDGTNSSYAHLRQNSARVKPGDFVQSGQTIAEVGLSGYICGAHLHYSVSRTNSDGHSIPTSFQDVSTNGGVPLAGGMYTSGNYFAQIVAQFVGEVKQDTPLFPPEGTVAIKLTGGTTYTLQLDAYDYESDDLKMRVADTEVGLDTAQWQSYATQLPWTASQAWVQYQDTDGLTSEVYSTAVDSSAYVPIQADFTAPDSVCTNQVIEIKNITAESCPQCAWKWLHGDGTSSTTEIPSTGALDYEDIAYSAPGVYTVSLTATNAITESMVAKQISVQASPNADFTMKRSGNTVIVAATDMSAATWEWDFGDGTTAIGQTVTHTYTNEALADLPAVQLKITAANACISELYNDVSQLVESKLFLPLATR